MTCPCGVNFCYACGIQLRANAGHLHRCPDAGLIDIYLNEGRALMAGETALKEYSKSHPNIRVRRKPNIANLIDPRVSNMIKQRSSGNKNPAYLNRAVGANQLPPRMDPMHQRARVRHAEEPFRGNFARHEYCGNRGLCHQRDVAEAEEHQGQRDSFQLMLEQLSGRAWIFIIVLFILFFMAISFFFPTRQP